MKSSYKIALVIAAALCLIVVVYYANQDSPTGNTPPIQNQPPPETLGASKTPETSPSSTSEGNRRTSLINRHKKSPATRETDLALRIKKLTANLPKTTPETGDSDGSSSNIAPHGNAGSLPGAGASSSAVPELRLDGVKKAPANEPPSTTKSTSSTGKQPAEHTIASGDTFGRIAAHYFGDEKYWVQIAQANPRLDPQGLRVGQVIRLPDLETINRKRRDEPAAAAPAKTVSYKVRPGDTLSSIAEAHYDGDANQWRYLYNANRKKIGSDPGRLKAGMTLTIPPIPKAAP